MEFYRKTLIKHCVRLIAHELAEHLQQLLKNELSASNISKGRRLMKPLKKKRLWIKNTTDRRYQECCSEIAPEIFSIDPSLSFLTSVGIDQEHFTWLLKKTSPFIQKQDTFMRYALPAHIKLKIVLGYLIMGGSYRHLSKQFQIPKNSISSFMSDVMSAICEALTEFIKVPSSDIEWKSIEKEFNEKYGFPNCCGSLNGKYIDIMSRKLPPNSNLTNSYNNTHYYQVVLLALVDAKHCFTYVNVEIRVQNKRDKKMFDETVFGKSLQSFNIPDNAVILANSSFPLKDNLMIPYSSTKVLSDKQISYNHYASKVLQVNDDTFKILCSKFRIFDKTISVGVDRIPSLVKSCCSLHNWLKKTNPSYMPPENLDLTLNDVESSSQYYPVGGALQNITKFPSSHSVSATEKQKWFVEYLHKESATSSDQNF